MQGNANPVDKLHTCLKKKSVDKGILADMLLQWCNRMGFVAIKGWLLVTEHRAATCFSATRAVVRVILTIMVAADRCGARTG